MIIVILLFPPCLASPKCILNSTSSWMRRDSLLCGQFISNNYPTSSFMWYNEASVEVSWVRGINEVRLQLFWWNWGKRNHNDEEIENQGKGAIYGYDLQMLHYRDTLLLLVFLLHSLYKYAGPHLSSWSIDSSIPITKHYLVIQVTHVVLFIRNIWEVNTEGPSPHKAILQLFLHCSAI